MAVTASSVGGLVVPAAAALAASTVSGDDRVAPPDRDMEGANYQVIRCVLLHANYFSPGST